MSLFDAVCQAIAAHPTPDEMESPAGLRIDQPSTAPVYKREFTWTNCHDSATATLWLWPFASLLFLVEIEDFLEVENWLNISLKLLLSSSEVDDLASEATDMRVPLVKEAALVGYRHYRLQDGVARPPWRLPAQRP